jgi:mycofactocin precursor
MLEPSAGTPDAEIELHDDVQADEPEATLVEEDLLVEDVSIDGMCGVY